MNIRLQEIELGTLDPNVSKSFYNSILGLETAVDEANLKVFNSGVAGMDFNTSTHLPGKIILTSFLTDDLQAIIERLNASRVPFQGPKTSHLGMISIEFQDPDGHLIRVNQPTDTSPSWLAV